MASGTGAAAQSSRASKFLASPMLCWGVGPLVAANLGYFVPMVALEWVSQQPWSEALKIKYGVTGKSRRPRQVALEEVHRDKMSFSKQLRGAIWQMLGPPGLSSAVFMTLIASRALSTPTKVLPSLRRFVFHLALLQVVDDFFLYMFHRLQHENEWLWKNVHSYHHQMTTPSPVSTVCIHHLDATLQAGLPIMLSLLLVKPHPVTFYVHLFLRLAENVANHSGMDWWVIDWLLLKRLPGRAPAAHHDSHHRFSNFGSGASNYAEYFDFFDKIGGTYRKVLTGDDATHP